MVGRQVLLMNCDELVWWGDKCSSFIGRRTLVQMVVAADTKRTALLAEAKDLEKQLEEGGIKWVKPDKLEGDSFEVSGLAAS